MEAGSILMMVERIVEDGIKGKMPKSFECLNQILLPRILLAKSFTICRT